MLEKLQTRIQFVDTHPSYLAAVSKSAQAASFLFDIEYTLLSKFEELESAVKVGVDVMVIGVGFSFSKNLPLVKSIIESKSDMAVAVIGSNNTIDEAKSALAVGARAYIQRSADQTPLLSALQVLLSGGIYIPGQLFSDQTKTAVSTGAESVDPFLDAKQRLHAAGATKRELIVAARLAQGSSNKFIARELGLTEGTVKTYVHRLLKLLGASNRTEAALSIARPTLPLKELSVRAASILTQAADSNLT